MSTEPQEFTREEIRARVRSLVKGGTTEHDKIADILKSEGFRTRANKPIKATAVRFFMAKGGKKTSKRGPKKPGYKRVNRTNGTKSVRGTSKRKTTLDTVAHILRSAEFGGPKQRVSTALAVITALKNG